MGKQAQTHHAVFLDFDTVSNGDIATAQFAESVPNLEIFPFTAARDLHNRIANADIVLCNKTQLDRRALEAAKKLKLIVLAATGTNNVDLAYAKQNGIAVCNLEDYCSTSVAEHVLMLCLALNRNLIRYQQAVSGGTWQENFCLLDFPIAELRGKHVGIIGHGALGLATAKLASAFGMKILIAERRGEPVRENRLAFEDVLRQADILSLHCPLNDETFHLISRAELQLMRPEAFLINTARGALIDTHALVEALKNRTIAGAGIDVLPTEPPSKDDVLLVNPMPQLIVTPHIAWASQTARLRAVKEMCLNVESFLSGGQRNRVV